jgi:hypothetical protein
MSQRRRGRAHNPFDGKSSTNSTFELDSAMYGEIEEEPSALQTQEDGIMHFGQFRLTAIGLELPERTSPDDWSELAQVLFHLQGRLHWLIGDFLLHENAWGDTDEIASQFGLEASTLYDYKSLARKVQISVRTEKLSPTHHKLVMKYSEEPELQRYWLQRAADEGWSVKEMRQAIRQAEQPELAEKTPSLTIRPAPLTTESLEVSLTQFVELHREADYEVREQAASVMRRAAERLLHAQNNDP